MVSEVGGHNFASLPHLSTPLCFVEAEMSRFVLTLTSAILLGSASFFRQVAKVM